MENKPGLFNLDFGLDAEGLVKIERDPYGPHRGHCVEIVFPGDENIVGFYKGLNGNGDLVLNPTFRQSQVTDNSRGTRTMNHSWVHDRPTYVPRGNHGPIKPADKSFYDSLVNRSNGGQLELFD